MATVAKDAQAVRVAKALGDPMRFRILREIASRPETSCSELVDRFTIGQPTVSHHLMVLAKAGLVAVRKEKGFHWYRLQGDVLAEHLRLLGGLSGDPAPRGRAKPMARRDRRP